MKSLTYFTSSFVFCALAMAAGYFIGGVQAVITVLFLTILETSLSFDNAVVNAGVLDSWDAAWRKRFLVWGMLVAVFGMRLIFPLVIVGIAGHIGPFHAVYLALNQPLEYSRILTSAHPQIAAFGGTFLMMVFFDFFIARHKTEHWLQAIEKPLTRLGKMEAIEAALTLVALIFTSKMIDNQIRSTFIEAGIWGIITYITIKGLGALINSEQSDVTQHVVKQGIGGFIYLELLDASFSFDGVIGAFAMTNNLFIITLGLGAGAMFVRSFTLLLVDSGTLTRYRYLEHGAFWAIGALAILMLIGVSWHISEMVTGLLGAALIAASFGSSILANRKQDAIDKQ
ncbi:MAG TPA: DUF475 domain-containing protein [Burkholderiaceae bacterium]